MGHDDLDSRVHDRVALDEIALYAEVLTAVAISERPLTLVELDDALGLRLRRVAEAIGKPFDDLVPDSSGVRDMVAGDSCSSGKLH